MKFEIKSQESESIELKNSTVLKGPRLGKCKGCSSLTKWEDALKNEKVCSEECYESLWIGDSKHEDALNAHLTEIINKKKKEILKDIEDSKNTTDEWKDIIIVVKDQLPYFKQCVESLLETTKKFHLYVWDNGSRPDTVDYIEKLTASCDDVDWKITTVRVEENVGFIEPNNKLVSLGTSPYVILLNSDTKVFSGWDAGLLGKLQNNPDIAQVGYWGGHLDETGKGFGGDTGFDVDYICGWCFCIKRETYDQIGLFDDVLMKFAYFEDSDFSLRIKDLGKKIYAIHTTLVEHYQNKTVIEVFHEKKIDITATFEHNRSVFQTKWKDYLENGRIFSGKN